MRKVSVGVAAVIGLSSLAGAALANPGTWVGDKAAACTAMADEGRSDAAALDVCDQALYQEGLSVQDKASVYVNRGAILIARRNWESAKADFDRALELDRDKGAAFVGLGAYYLGVERFDAVEAEVNKGLNLGTEQPEKAYYIRAMARWALDDLTGAYKDFATAAKIKPSWGEPKRAMANFITTPAG